MPERWTSQDLIPHLYTVFKIETPTASDVEIELELTDIADRSSARVEQFSLLFAGPQSPLLPQATYVLDHPRMGELSLFLVPLGPRNGKMVYQAAFTRLIPDLQALPHD